MAERVHLDEAARQSGKSEITIRRLIKAAKIPFAKETTLTGFVYLVDPEDVKAYYAGAKKSLASEVSVDQPKPVIEDIAVSNEKSAAQDVPAEALQPIKDESPVVEEVVAQKVEPTPETPIQKEQAVADDAKPSHPTRVAVGNEVGGIGEYWRKRATIYEQRLEQEVAEHERTREELEALRKQKGVRPAKEAVRSVSSIEAAPVKAPKDKVAKSDDEISAGTLVVWVVGILVFLGALGGIAYWFFVNLQ